MMNMKLLAVLTSPSIYHNDWLRITSFDSSLMFYVANVITFSVFLKLLWKYTLILRYKLNLFQPPRVNHFDICALLLGGYARFKPLDKMVFYGYRKTLPSGSSPMLHIYLILFLLCYGLCCCLSNYYLNNYNSVLRYVCLYY